jgi:hypothetical protein
MRDELTRVREWAAAKLTTGAEPPWSWYQLMKLNEAIDAILAGMAVVTTESSPPEGARPETHLRLVEATCPQDTSRPRPAGLPVQLPM